MKNTLIIIPSRMNSTRLPGKPLLDMEGIPMVIRVAKQALASKVGDVIIACCDEAIYKVANSYGINAVYTRDNHSSGSDRIYEALNNIDPLKKIETIINLQGDMPTISPNTINSILDYKQLVNSDIYTLATKINNSEEKHDPNVVKVVISKDCKNSFGKALYFSRSPVPYGKGPLYHHIGIYGYTRESLERFVKLKPSELELRESLEQLRAMEANMNVHVGIIDEIPIGVDNLADFKKACEYIKKNKDL